MEFLRFDGEDEAKVITFSFLLKENATGKGTKKSEAFWFIVKKEKAHD